MRIGNVDGRAALITESSAVDVGQASGGRFGPSPHACYDDWEAFCFLTMSLLAAQYLRMRSDIARRFAGVSRCVFSRR